MAGKVTREEAVQALVRFARPLEDLREALATFEWDWDSRALASLTSTDIASVLHRYEAGELSAAEVEDWANLIEGREDIDLDDRTSEAIFDLANPVLQGPLSETGPALLAKL